MVNAVIQTIDQLVDALGGTGEVGEWADIGANAVANWIARGWIPPGWHLRLYIEANRRGLKLAYERLFGLSTDDAEILRACVAAARLRGDRARPRPSA